MGTGPAHFTSTPKGGGARRVVRHVPLERVPARPGATAREETGSASGEKSVASRRPSSPSVPSSAVRRPPPPPPGAVGRPALATPVALGYPEANVALRTRL